MSDSVDLTLIKQHLKDKYNLGEEQQNKLIRVSAQSVRESLDAAEKALAESDLDALAEFAHKLKGTLLIISLNDWADRVDHIRSAAEQGVMLDFKTELGMVRTGLKLLCEMEADD